MDKQVKETEKIKCEGQYYKNGMCTETERPSGTMRPCNRKECYLEPEDK